MHPTPLALGKGTLKYGGKSGILPKLRPIFKNPIMPPPDYVKEKEAKLEQGYAKGVTPPKVDGRRVSRVPKPKKIVPVEELIRKRVEREPNVDVSKLEGDALWAYKRDQIRKEHLRDAYLTEAKRLEKLEQLKARKHELEEQHKAEDKQHEDSEATKLTLPTIDSYLKGPIMRQRTPEEKAIKEEQRALNRRVEELKVQEARATELLELYHAAGSFITTEEELSEAIREAFEVKVGQFESNEHLVEDKLFGYSNVYANTKTNERAVKDAAFGEIDGQPGLQTVRDTLSGENEKLRRDAQAELNKDA